MNDETLNTEIRRFLKKVGIQSHQAIAPHQTMENLYGKDPREKSQG